jgi:DNA adenine methylase
MRKLRGLTQHAAAARAGIDVNTVASLERGAGTLQPLIMLLRILECSFPGQRPQEEFGAWLAESRRFSGHSQRKLAALAQISHPTLIQLERGRGRLSSMYAVAEALGLELTLQPFEAHVVDAETSAARSPLRYPGGKTRALKTLYRHLPSEIDEFRDPFMGGGSVALFVSGLYPDASVWINDIYKPLVSFWRVLQDPIRSKELVERLQNLKHQNDDEASARLLFERTRRELLCGKSDEIAEAVGFYIANRCSYSGLTASGSFSAGAAHGRWTMSHIARLAEYAPLLARWHITNLDYRDVVGLRWSGAAPFLFLDPPYNIRSSKLYGIRGDIHRHFDHEAFRSVIEGARVRTLITYNAGRNTGQAFPTWQQTIFDLKYSVRSTGRYRARQEARRESILRNYRLIDNRSDRLLNNTEACNSVSSLVAAE